MLGKAAKCASKEYLKNAYAEGRTSEHQNSLVKQIDIKDFETSFVPTPSLSPPGRHESSPKIPDLIIKAKDLPAHQVSASINKTFLKEISEEKLKPVAELSVSGFILVYICGQYILLGSVLFHFAHIFSSICFLSFGWSLMYFLSYLDVF